MERPEETHGRVLVVDDQEVNLLVLERLLSKVGYQVRTAVNGAAALAAVDAEVPDLVLLDVMMPDMSGLDVLARLRAQFSASALPVIMVTALGDAESVVAALDAGANDYLTKPVEGPVCQARIRTHLALKRAIEDLESRNRQLEAIDREKNRLLGMAAHDLRNPLAVLQHYSTLN